MKKSSPAIVFKSKFLLSTNKKYKSYIDYIDREEAIRNESYKRYSLYNDYMGNPTKTTGIFTKEKNLLDEKEKILLKENFSKAQLNNSVMWQEVYSFDNKWLEQQMLYDPNTKYLDEEKIKNAIRKSIEYSLEKTDMKESALWSGAIHYNTDNIHIHVAICEPNKTRERGKRTQKTLDMMKSKFINHLLDFDEEYKEINKILRDNLVKSAKDFDLSKDIEMKKLINEVIKNLPSDSRHWHYNYNTMKDANKHLDKLTEHYIKNYKYDEYKEFIDKLDKHEERLKDIYGVGKRKKYKEYKKNKIDELYTRMGNTFLSEMKDILKEEKEKNKIKNINNTKNDNPKNNESNIHKKDLKKDLNMTNISKKDLNLINISRKDLNRIGKALGSELDNLKNQSKYLELERKIEYSM